jgi:hypothetical protein
LQAISLLSKSSRYLQASSANPCLACAVKLRLWCPHPGRNRKQGRGSQRSEMRSAILWWICYQFCAALLSQ